MAEKAEHRIHIIGGPGSGKTYLAADLSRATGIPHIDLDGLYWNEDFSERRPPEERSGRLEDAVAGGRWIVEGAYCGDWVLPSLEVADQIVLLRVPLWVQYGRLACRNVDRLLEGTTTLRATMNLMRWVRGFEERLDVYKQGFGKSFASKTIELNGRSAIAEFFNAACMSGEHDSGEMK